MGNKTSSSSDKIKWNNTQIPQIETQGILGYGIEYTQTLLNNAHIQHALIHLIHLNENQDAIDILRDTCRHLPQILVSDSPSVEGYTINEWQVSYVCISPRFLFLQREISEYERLYFGMLSGIVLFRQVCQWLVKRNKKEEEETDDENEVQGGEYMEEYLFGGELSVSKENKLCWNEQFVDVIWVLEVMSDLLKRGKDFEIGDLNQPRLEFDTEGFTMEMIEQGRAFVEGDNVYHQEMLSAKEELSQ
eukprot:TRINITY_DN10336_c0_g1_i1.p2 TRINITY_DN10336_c0_g1~~TRINITY_DN10336_c0_g1_i1.p2  ORF type:complete len:247 (+),score=64.91 TRINITY_DN10336_c0_g1_i1:18-758(+)